MFGEIDMYGQTEIAKDEKNRILLPPFTKAEKKDVLLLVKFDEYVEIYKEETYNAFIDELFLKLKNSVDVEEIRKIKLVLLEMYKNILKKVVCDSYKRINVSSIFDEEKKVLCIGAKDHIVLQRIKEDRIK